jgi:hypothetical protein
MLSHRHPLTRRDFPASLRPLTELAMNLWWSWDAEATTLMRDITRWRCCWTSPTPT